MKTRTQETSSAIDLGIAILHALALPGISYGRDEIAAFAGCSRSRIQQIEAKALKKVLRRLGRHTFADHL